jgi:hypothetical protein
MRSPRNDSAAQQVDHLVDASNQRYVREPTLYLCPFVTDFAAQPRSVLLERLMKNANYDEAAFRARGGLGQLLEKVNVAALSRGAFKKLAELVNYEQNAVTGARSRFLNKPLNEFATGFEFASWPAAVCTVPTPRLFERFRDVGNRVATAADDGNNKPTIFCRLKRAQQPLGGVRTQRNRRCVAHNALRTEETSECYGET